MNNLRVFLCAAAVFLIAASGSFAASFDEQAEQELLRLANQERARAGLQPLQFNAQLRQAARDHSQLMAEHKVLAHDFPGELPLRQRLAGTGLRSDSDAENVAFNQTAVSAHQGFMNSPPHRANILNPKYNAAGIAAVRRGDTLWITEDFAHVFASYSPADVERIIREQVNEIRSNARLPSLPVRSVEQLRKIACSMGESDKAQPRLALSSTQARRAAAFTSTEPQKLPSQAEDVAKTTPANSFGVGACFTHSAKYPAGVYWIVLVVN
jgi:hypothetical protein